MTKQLTESQERQLRSILNSSRLAGLEPTAEDEAVARRIMLGEITAGEAIAEAIRKFGLTVGM